MVLRRNTAEGQPNTTTMNAGNSGGGSGNAFDQVARSGAATAVYSTDVAMHGTRSYKIGANNNDSLTLLYASGGDSVGAMQVYLYLTALPTGAAAVMQVYVGGNLAAGLTIATNGAINVNNAAGFLAASAGAIPLNTWLRFDLLVTPGTTTSNGRIQAAYYPGDIATATWTYDSGATTNTRTGLIDSYRAGKLDSTGDFATFYVDDMAADTGRSSFIPVGALTNDPPTAAAGLDVANIEPYTTQTLTGTDADSDGTVVTRTWRQISGVAVTLSGSGAVRTYTAPGTISGTTLIFGYKVTDNSGDSSPEATVTHTVLFATERAVIGGVEVPVEVREN